MRAESLVYTPILGGPRSGLFALELTLGPGRKASPDSLAREIIQAGERVSPRSAIFSLVGGGSASEDEEPEIRKLLRLLREASLNLSASLPGGSFPVWLDFIQYRTMELLNEPEHALWAAQEIRYFPTDIWEEPRIARMNDGAMKYVVVPKGTPMEKIVSFQSASRHTWGIIQEPRAVYMMKFFGPEGA